VIVDLPARQRVAFLLGPERIEVREVPLPRPGPGELVVRIDAATTCGTDLKVFLRGGHPRMLTAPCPFGHELAGRVAAIGAGVTRFHDGDRVVVLNSAPCGACEFCRAGRENLCRDLVYLNGAFAEYLVVPARFVASSTYTCADGLAAELAALTEPLACVLHGVEVCGLDSATEVAVIGVGPIGLLFVASLAAAGHRVIAVDLEASRLAVAREMGAAATAVFEPGGDLEPIAALTGNGDGAPFVVEATGSPAAWVQAISLARAGGTVLLFGGCPPGSSVPLDTHRLHYSELTVRGAYHHRPATARRALEMLAGGRLDLRPLLSETRPLADVEGALRAMQRREALKVVVRP
jgi:L-iditol 2-dehydrogenase